jgi:hypothetical protein
MSAFFTGFWTWAMAHEICALLILLGVLQTISTIVKAITGVFKRPVVGGTAILQELGRVVRPREAPEAVPELPPPGSSRQPSTVRTAQDLRPETSSQLDGGNVRSRLDPTRPRRSMWQRIMED